MLSKQLQNTDKIQHKILKTFWTKVLSKLKIHEALHPITTSSTRRTTTHPHFIPVFLHLEFLDWFTKLSLTTFRAPIIFVTAPNLDSWTSGSFRTMQDDALCMQCCYTLTPRVPRSLSWYCLIIYYQSIVREIMRRKDEYKGVIELPFTAPSSTELSTSYVSSSEMRIRYIWLSPTLSLSIFCVHPKHI